MNNASVMPVEPQPSDVLMARLHDIFVRVLDTEVPAEDTDLIDSGLLDSLALVSLIMELETEFALVISYDELEIDNFRTLRSIAGFVAARQDGSS